MFKQGQKPVIIIPKLKLISLAEALHAAGYDRHTGARITRSGEVMTYRKQFAGAATPEKKDRQNHVQLVVVPEEDGLAVFAHTEPYGYGWKHLVSAVCDRANYGAGAAMLLRDVQEKGFKHG